MGGKLLLNFLQQMPQQWKDKNVKQFISLATPWGGSVKTIQALSIGYDFGVKLINSQKMKELQETYPSVVWLLPSKQFWKPDEVLVIMEKKNYTLVNIDQCFLDIGLANIADMRKDLSSHDKSSLHLVWKCIACLVK